MKAIVLLFLLLSSFTAAAQTSRFEQQKDSLQQAIKTQKGEEKLNSYNQLSKLLFFYQEDINENLKVFADFQAEAHRQNNVRQEVQARAIALNFLSNRCEFDKFWARVEDDLSFAKKNKVWNRYFNMSSTKFMILINSSKIEDALKMAQNLYEEAKNLVEYPAGEAMALNFLGYAYKGAERMQEALTYFKKSVEVGQKNGSCNDVLFQSYYEINALYCSLKMPVEAEKTLAQWEKAILLCEKQQGYSPILWQQYYNGAIYLADLKQEYGKVEQYLNLLDSIALNNDALLDNITFSRMELYLHTAEWNKALKYALICVNNKNVSLDAKRGCYYYLSSIYTHLGKADDAVAAMDTAFLYSDSIKNSAFNAQLDELRTQYEVDKHILEKERNRNNFLFALAGCLLLATALGIYIYCSRKIARKNRTLVEQVRKLVVQQELREEELLRKTTFEPAETPNDDGFCPESRRDKLCIALRDMILREKVYRNPVLAREQVIEQLGTNRHLFDEAVQYCFGMSFTDYVNTLRMKDAIMLLEQSDLPVEIIAERAGYGTLRTFQRQFGRQYNMSPKEYRKFAAENK